MTSKRGKNIVPKKLELYYMHRSRMKTGDVIEFRSYTLIGCVIRKVTGQYVNHTALVLRLQHYDQDRVFLLEAVPDGGVVLTKLSDRLKAQRGTASWLGLTGSWDTFRPAVGRAALNYVGTSYDFGNVIKEAFARVNADARRLFCSEFAYLALLDGGLPVHRDKAPVPGQMYALGVFHRPRLIL